MGRNLDTDLLRAFVAVADTGSFTNAGEMTYRTQSAVSMQIKRLEDLLSAKLFVRSNKGLQLTPDGDRLLDYARPLVAMNDEAVATLLDRRAYGVVRIGMMEDYASDVFPTILKRFMEDHPRVYVEIHGGLSSQMPQMLGRQFDLVLAMHAEGAGNGKVVRKEQPVWACSRDFDLCGHEEMPVALYPRDCVFRDLAIDALEQSDRPWRPAFNSGNISAVRAAVREGIAVGVFKQSTLAPDLRLLKPEDGFADMPVVDISLYRSSGRQSAAANALAEFLTANLNDMPTAPQRYQLCSS